MYEKIIGTMDSGLLGSAIFFLTLVLVMFGLRVYVRAFLIRKWGLDDWLITCATVTFTIYVPCQIAGIVNGIGRHLNELSAEQAKRALMFWWICEIFYIPSTVFMKLSVGVFLHRLAIKQCHIWIIRFMSLATALFGTTYFLLAIFQCHPINAWWVKKHAPPESQKYGTCIHNGTVVVVTFISCSLNAVADCTFGLLPIFIVKDLQMPIKQKKLVAIILGFANIACVATIVRTPFTIKFFKDDDFLYETRTFALLSTIEPGVGIAAICSVALRPLLQRIVGAGAKGWFSVPLAPGEPGKPGSYSKGGSPAKFPIVYGSKYTEISAASQPSQTRARDPAITGKEMRDLVSDIGHLDEPMSLHERDSNVVCILQRHDDQKEEEVATIRTDKTVGFTFFDDTEGPESVKAIDLDLDRPLPPLPPAPYNESSNTKFRKEDVDQDKYVRAYRRNMGSSGRPPGAVGDPFGAWR